MWDMVEKCVCDVLVNFLGGMVMDCIECLWEAQCLWEAPYLWKVKMLMPSIMPMRGTVLNHLSGYDLYDWLCVWCVVLWWIVLCVGYCGLWLRMGPLQRSYLCKRYTIMCLFIWVSIIFHWALYTHPFLCIPCRFSHSRRVFAWGVTESPSHYPLLDTGWWSWVGVF